MTQYIASAFGNSGYRMGEGPTLPRQMWSWEEQWICFDVSDWPASERFVVASLAKSKAQSSVAGQRIGMEARVEPSHRA